MKKKFYFATLVIAALSFTGCANDEYVGDQQNLGEQNAAIAFSTKSENTVRATWENDKAAEKLNHQFWVYGWKEKIQKDAEGNTSITGKALVFNNYVVKYPTGTTSTSNTNRWEYVGKGDNGGQTIKYWDYSFDQYEFEAYSFKKESQGTVSRNTTEGLSNGLDVGDYIVENLNEGEYASLYFADKTTVQKSSDPEGEEYGKPVKLTFKSVLSKIRVGFYETIPGYSVKITKFYGPNGDGTGWANEDDGSNFVAWCPNKKIEGNIMSFVVSYDGTTPAVTKVKKDDGYQAISVENSQGAYTLNPKLELGYHLLYSRNGSKNIGDSYSNVTWDQYEVNDGPSKYTYVIPQDGLYNSSEENSQVKAMKIKVDYTLKSEDSEETIEVKGATAIVPAEYLSWKANTAYSYVFRISDRTNGNTGDPSTDPAGLYPITFDAVVEDMAENNNYLTTVSELSITATQDEGQFTVADEVVFEKTKDIKVKVMQYMTDGGVLTAADRTGNVGASTPASGDSFTAVFVEVANYDSSKSLDEYLTGKSTEHTYENSDNLDYIKLPQKDKGTAGYWIVKVTFRETIGGNTKDITKYAVLKVG